ncbi:glycosyltransferase [Bacteroidia bacterium]|nr:glycosyltransferase [Bacteroidia bacterium]MDB9881618.1 glycosyltransferase [Bacteroidia bacterium]MDC1395074.1 glycosyltransferase [Bacteroidia bacterium]
MIPKIIHYCWYGNSVKPQMVLDCIQSWRKLHPEYEIKEWNEFNSPKHHIVTSNIKNKIWAYASDYTRLYALYTYGGFYLDTDFFLLKSLEELRTEHCILAFESREWVTNGFAASSKHHSFFKECLKALEQKGHTRLKPYIAPHLTTDILKTYQSTLEYKDQTISGIRILLAPTFYPFTYNEVRNNTLNSLIASCPKSSYGIHLFMHSWKDSSLDYNSLERLSLLFRKLMTKLKYVREQS